MEIVNCVNGGKLLRIQTYMEDMSHIKKLYRVKVHLSGNSYIGKVALAAYFHRAHYNSPMALAAYFCRYPASCGISRAVPKVSESSTGGAVRTDQWTRRPRLIFSRQPLKLRIVGHHSL
jgi:hypothetical protein